MKPRICLIEDDPIMGEALVERLDIEGYDCDWFKNGRDALQPLQNKPYALAISDIRLPDISGEELFITLHSPTQPPFLFITGHGAIDQAVRLLKLGAEDYQTKPLNIPLLMSKVSELCTRTLPTTGSSGQLGISSAMRRIETMLPRMAASARSVLITGESGVGKEVVARALHDSACAEETQPFVAVNCGAISETLIEAELFGHEKGAFTGASSARRGYFEQANGGTLFLDEIGDMPLRMQVKLLRAIQERCVVRVGGEKQIPVNIRLICATHCDLKKKVETGEFREDLYYRIHVVQINIPPLRERREDILWLADRFLAELSADGSPRSLDVSAETALLAAPWHGNVRELRHCLECACVMSTSRILTADTLLGTNEDATTDDVPHTLANCVAVFERRHIAETLATHDWSIAETAAQLGISRKNLWEKMKRHGITDR